MNEVKNLVDAISSGDSEEIKSSFNRAMLTKIGDSLDSRKREFAKGLFNQNEAN